MVKKQVPQFLVGYIHIVIRQIALYTIGDSGPILLL